MHIDRLANFLKPWLVCSNLAYHFEILSTACNYEIPSRHIQKHFVKQDVPRKTPGRKTFAKC